MPETDRYDSLPIINRGERHVPVVLVVDISDDMSGKPIQEINEGLAALEQLFREDDFASERADISVISFNSSVNTEEAFRPAELYKAPVLTAGGLTALNEAIIKALDAIEARKKEYKNVGTDYYRPWLFLMTAGKPTDADKEAEAKRRLREAIEQKKVVFMPMEIGNADTAKLQEYYPENYVDAHGNPLPKVVVKGKVGDLREAFEWLGPVNIRTSTPDLGQVQLPPAPSIHIDV